MSATACVEDDLEYNPFYLALQEHFTSVLQDAQQKCHIICVPHSHVLDGQVIDRAFVGAHILKPSPYFRGYYVTTDRGNSKSLQLDNNVLKTSEGFPDERIINILADEMGYNKDFKPYKILILDSTIWPPPNVLLSRPADGSLTSLPFKTTLEENTAYLKSYTEHQQALNNLDRSIKVFNENYMVLQKYLLDAAGRLEQIWNNATLEFTQSSNQRDGRYYQHLIVAIETYIMDGVHQKVFAVIKPAQSRSDQLLEKKKPTITTIPGEVLGLAAHFCCPQNTAVAEVARLDALTTPIEKLVCMKHTLDAISKTVNQHLNMTYTLQNKDTPCLASDDLLPLLVQVIAGSKTRHLAAHIYHVENFHWSTSSTDDLSYTLVTFKAAMQYITDTDFTQFLPQKLAHKKQIDGRKPVQPALSTPAISTSREPEMSDIKMTQFDRQMERITKMLDVSTRGLVLDTPHPPLPRSQPHRFTYGSSVASLGRPAQPPKDSGLGEFLSSLKADSWHSSYGKQT